MNKLKILITLTFFCFQFSLIISQNNKLSIDLNLPVPLGNNYISENYNGVFDFGLKFNFIKFSKLDFGLSGNFGLLHNETVNILKFRPRLSAETKLWKLSPYLGLGYSYFYYNVDSNLPDEIDKSSDGPNINLGMKFQLISKLYINVGYDFIKLRTEEMVNNAYNRNIQFIDFGVGLQF